MFNPDDEGIPLVTIALVLTAVCLSLRSFSWYILNCGLQVENVLDEWQTGERSDLLFSEVAYRQKFEEHLATLQEFEGKPGGREFLLKLRRKMYRIAR